MRIHIHHIHHHYYESDEIKSQLQLIINQNIKIMATEQQFLDIISRVDTTTDKIAVDIRLLKEQIKGGGLSPEVEDSVLGKLEAVAVKLEAVGTEPIPPTP